MTVAEAAGLVDFVPQVPAELGEPDAVDVSDDRVIVSMSWSTADGVVRLDQFDGRLDFGIAKTSPGVQYARVGDTDALWFERPHEVVILDDQDRPRTETARLAGHTLIWPAGRRHAAAGGRPQPRARRRDRSFRGAVRRADRRPRGTSGVLGGVAAAPTRGGTMRVTLARAATFAAVLLSAFALPAAPAAAGGPTSALLSIPGAGSTASLYYTDPEYDELADLVGVVRAERHVRRVRSRAPATSSAPA